MTKRAILLGGASSSQQHLRLSRILDFFSVPWETKETSRLFEIHSDSVVFGSAEGVAAAVAQLGMATLISTRCVAFYVFAGDDRKSSERGFQVLYGSGDVRLREAPVGKVSLRVSDKFADLTGAMAGVRTLSRLRREDGIFVGPPSEESGFATVISAAGAPVFGRFQRDSIPFFFCGSSHVVDIDQPAGPGFYDVKDHFCSVVPLVMFLRSMFSDTAWKPQELGACLIIDDPLLKSRYGSCDFGRLLEMMKRHEFTTNISFIPWNWRRTSNAAGKFFRKESGHYSVSVHGCDHIGAEFGSTAPAVLDGKAKLAQFRMQSHKARTGIQHDPVMIFPQGVFSSACPAVLKRNGFLAAVNTETVPVDSDNARTKISDLWDVAIMSYQGFPIFTRRYSFHGLENFAFDLLLGKPCLIVCHHDFFKDDGSELLELIDNLKSLNCSLVWRPLGDVIRRACQRRVSGPGMEEVEMYSSELVIDNASDQSIELRVRKREDQIDLVADMLVDGKPVMWLKKDDHISVIGKIPRRSEMNFQIAYRRRDGVETFGRSLKFELSVAARRFLSEFRDDYLSKSQFLSATAASLKNVVTRAS